jgi:hypothetical protein
MQPSPTREVIVHSRTRTVHELRSDGSTRCGNGGNKPQRYVRMQANQAPAGARACERCASIPAR